MRSSERKSNAEGSPYFGGLTRNLNFSQKRRTQTLKVEDEVEIVISGDHGTNGRPRYREIQKPLP